MKNRIVLFLMLFIMLAGCSDINNSGDSIITDNDRDELVLAIGGEPEDGFDPTTGWGLYGSPLFQSTLLSYDKDFNIVHDLASNYGVSDDGLIWTIELREDVQFSDGEPLTSEDIVFTFETTKNSGAIIDLSNLEKVTAIDEKTIEFTLKHPDSTFIQLLITTGIVPKHLYDEGYNENPIGSGPYQLVEWEKGQQLIVEANPYYYGQKPFFQKVTFLFLSEDAAFAAAKAGDVDVASIPTTFAEESVPGMKLVDLESVDNRGVMFPFVSSGEETAEGYPIGNDVTADIAIRKAINIGVDRKALVDGVLNGYGTPAYSIADKLPWWNPETAFEDNNIEQAKEILDEAGWKLNENGVREKDRITASFSLLYPADDVTRQSLSMAFAEMMKPLGIMVKTEGHSWNELEKRMFSEPIMMGWGSHNPIEIYNLYSSTTRGIGYYNTNYYSNKTVDEYLEKALRATTQEEANTFWKKAAWDGETGFSLKGDASWAWLVNIDHLYFVNEDLVIGEQKIQPHGHGWPITDYIQHWHWKN